MEVIRQDCFWYCKELVRCTVRQIEYLTFTQIRLENGSHSMRIEIARMAACHVIVDASVKLCAQPGDVRGTTADAEKVQRISEQIQGYV